MTDSPSPYQWSPFVNPIPASVAPYAERMKRHLAEYKRQRIGVEADGEWSRGGSYAHILPSSLAKLNILEGIRREFWEYYEERKSVLPLHTDFHHLNSSQAFAFNLFFPWVGNAEPADPLLSALGITGRVWTDGQFEVMPDAAEQTTVDVLGELQDGGRIFIEVKLTESAFGSCDPKDSHRKKLKEWYAPRLVERAVVGSDADAEFFAQYQLYRNLCHLDVPRGDVEVTEVSV
jgi:hypothetical protein